DWSLSDRITCIGKFSSNFSNRHRCRRIRRMDGASAPEKRRQRHIARCVGPRKFSLQFRRRVPHHSRNVWFRTYLYADGSTVSADVARVRTTMECEALLSYWRALDDRRG